MKRTDHKITVLMPAFNVERYIADAITSVLDQTFTFFELLIINDGSTDNTQQIIRSFSDDRIRLINQSNQGIAAALNLGLINTNTELIARFDADDICLPERLQLQYDFLMAHPDHDIVGSDAAYIDMNGDFVFSYSMPAHTSGEIEKLVQTKCPFIHSAVLFRKVAIMQAGGYDINAFAFQDHLLWNKMIKKGKAFNIPQQLLQVRLNPESLSIDEKWRTKRYRQIKTAAIERGNITKDEGEELQRILKAQHNKKIKEGSYYSLLGKKYLWNNYQPQKARAHLKKAISVSPLRFDSYAFIALSFLPEPFIKWAYHVKTNKL